MIKRGEGADSSKDIGPWKHSERVLPYETWTKRLSGGDRASVLVEDASPGSNDEYWVHIEYTQNGEWKWAPDKIAAGDERSAVVAQAREWMHRNRDWQPVNRSGPFGMGSGGSWL